jgi:ribonuclease-3
VRRREKFFKFSLICRSMDITKVEEKIGYKFSAGNKNLLLRALTRKAFAKEQQDRNQDCDDQEVLSTLGDAVWGLVLTDLLYPDCTTKEELTNKRKELVEHPAQAEIAQRLEIEQAIRMTNGERKDEPRVAILEATLEALVGAIFIDAGYDETKEVVRKWFTLA